MVMVMGNGNGKQHVPRTSMYHPEVSLYVQPDYNYKNKSTAIVYAGKSMSEAKYKV